eukprot:gene5943-4252_t
MKPPAMPMAGETVVNARNKKDREGDLSWPHTRRRVEERHVRPNEAYRVFE